MLFWAEFIIINNLLCAGVVELADARDSKSRDGDIVWVRPPPPAPFKKNRFDTIRIRPFSLQKGCFFLSVHKHQSLVEVFNRTFARLFFFLQFATERKGQQRNDRYCYGTIGVFLIKFFIVTSTIPHFLNFCPKITQILQCLMKFDLLFFQE